MSRCKVLDIIANPKGMYMYDKCGDYNNAIMDAFDIVYTNVQMSVKNADEIERNGRCSYTAVGLYQCSFSI